MMPPSLWRTRRRTSSNTSRHKVPLKGALDIYVNAVREAYPDLKANTNFMALQTELEGTEKPDLYRTQALHGGGDGLQHKHQEISD